MFDKLLNPPSSVDHPAPEFIAPIAEVVAPEPAASTGSPFSTTVDQDAPSPSNSQTIPETQYLVISNDVEEENQDLDVAHMNNNPFFGIPIPENNSEASSSSNVIPTIVHTATPNSEHVTKWTKDHPLDNIIGVGSTTGIRACGLRNFDLEVMELENTQNNALAKLPMLKLGEYEMWEIRIKQYFQIQDYALWEVIENRNSWVPIPVTAPETGPSTATKMTVPSTAKDYVDAQSMFAAIKARFGGNGATKKTHKDLLKNIMKTLTLQALDITCSIFIGFKALMPQYMLSISTQPQGSQLVHEDLEQLHDDDLEEMDLKWNMALLSMRARKFYQRTGRKIIIDGSSTAGYDKSKVECFNCHKMGHFARECRAPRSKDNRNWNQGSSSKAVRIEDASEKAMCAIDGAGFDWSDMAEEEIQANMALMAFSDSEVTNDKSCSKSCLQNYEALKKQYDDLLVKLDDTGFKASTYKRGLSILEGQILKYKESEVLFSEEIALLKRSVGHKEYLIGLLRTELEKLCTSYFGDASPKIVDDAQIEDKDELHRLEEPKKESENTDVHFDIFTKSQSLLFWILQGTGLVIGVRLSTSASGSQPSGNTKNDRILQTPSSNSKNKVEAHPRNVKSSLNKKNGTVNVNGSAVVQNLKKQDLKFGNDQVAKIMGYGDYQIGNVTISRVYYVEGLGHNLFSVGQFCDSNLEVAFRQHTCFIRNLEGVDLLTGSRGDNLYTLSLGNMMASSPICLLSKASKTKSWLWHRRLSHLNFGAINHLARHGLVRGLPKLKFEKDHLCSACALGKSSKKPHKPKSEDTNQEKLYLLHMDLCGPMRVASVNGKKYILVIVDDYSRFTWVKCLRSKDEAPAFIINFLKMIQVRLKETVRRIRTDNGTEFVNQTLREYYEKVGISHETSVARSP
ncbi:retrovirus-related pol polyprotein from transposon TNT 1-94 [Tanacetum coccineum]